MIKSVLVIVLLVLTNLCFRVNCDTGFDLVIECPTQQYYDTAGLICLDCQEGQKVAADGRKCECESRHALFYDSTNKSSFNFGDCQPCSGQASSFYYNYCVTCDESEGQVEERSAGGSLLASSVQWQPARLSQGVCECENSYGAVISEIALDGSVFVSSNGEFVQRCVKCGANSVPDTELHRCVSCEYPKQVVSGQCQCPGQLPEGATCTDQTDLAYVTSELKINSANSFKVSFDVVYAFDANGKYLSDELASRRTIDVEQSQVLFQNLGPVSKSCLNSGTREACNMLANLCVLNLYNRQSKACQFFSGIQSSRSSVQYRSDQHITSIGWSLTLPWLYYEGLISQYLDSEDIQLNVTLSENDLSTSVVSQLTIILSTHALNGTWLGFRNLTTQLQLCGGMKEYTNSWTTFGVGYQNECSLSLLELLEGELEDSEEPLFYDAYLRDGLDRIYPIPVLLLNYKQDGNYINSLAEPRQLVSRFFRVDSVLGKQSGSATSSVIQYLDSANITIRVRNDAPNKIYPPLITLKYAAIESERLQSSYGHSSFEVYYKNSDSALATFWRAWIVMLIVFLVLSSFLWVFRVFIFVRRRRNETFDFQLLLYAILEGSEAASIGLLTALMGISLYTLLFFKLQGEVYILVPQNDELMRIKIGVISACACATLAIIRLVYRQVTCDVFFIDWEKARRVLEKGGFGEMNAPVSCWRMLLVANEWNELQTIRKTNTAFTLLLMLFFLLGVGLENQATLAPKSAQQISPDLVPNSIILQFGISASFFIVGALLQLLYNVCFHYPYVENPLTQFIDLLFLSNISAIVFDDRYAGYYIHGRNQSQFSDTSLADINLSLLNEVQGLVAERGLVSSTATPNDQGQFTENQTFTIFVRPSFRHQYEEQVLRLIFGEMKSQRQIQQRGGSQRGGNSFSARFNVPVEDLMQARDQIARSFQKLVSEVENNHATQVLQPSYFQRIFRVPPDMSANKSVFVHDFHNSFAGVLLFGNEIKLLIWELLLYCCADMFIQNPIISACITFVISYFMTWIRQYFGTQNISRKTLIDKHFLI